MVVHMWDSGVLRQWLQLAVSGLEAACPTIDAVNVFPIADQDTGTNCVLTLRGAAEQLAGLPATATGPQVLAAAARGALLAARGNSGMILSHYLSGMAVAAGEPVESAGEGVRVAAILAAGAHSARRAVLTPEDGTVLTLADVVACTANDLAEARQTAGSREVLAAAVSAGHDQLAAISAVHPVLHTAAVLDAGACALLVVLDAFITAMDGGTIVDLSWLPDPAPVEVPEDEGAGQYEVMAVSVIGPTTWRSDRLRAELGQEGDSVVVVDEPMRLDDQRLRHSHVHTANPGTAVQILAAAAPDQLLVSAVHALSGDRQPVVAVTTRPDRAVALAATGAVVLVLREGGDTEVESHGAFGTPALAVALTRAIRDACGGSPSDGLAADGLPHHGKSTVPVVVLPGLAAGLITQTGLELPSTLLTEADDEDRVLLCATLLAAGGTPDQVRVAIDSPSQRGIGSPASPAVDEVTHG